MDILIVDGYNAIHKIPHLSEKLSRSLHSARQGLAALVREYQRRNGAIVDFYLVFDGRDRQEPDLFPPPHQVFSARGEGDRQIIRLVEKYSKKHRVVVASDDNFVRNNARAHRARVISIAEFAAAASPAKKRPPRAGNDERKIGPEAEKRINEELKRHWKL